jgi:hypothetical protein
MLRVPGDARPVVVVVLVVVVVVLAVELVVVVEAEVEVEVAGVVAAVLAAAHRVVVVASTPDGSADAGDSAVPAMTSPAAAATQATDVRACRRGPIRLVNLGPLDRAPFRLPGRVAAGAAARRGPGVRLP